MNALSDQQLLSAYAERRSEAAFAELVRRHIDLVHSAAVRMVNDPHLAQDVSQGVFVALAKDAGKLTDHPVLSGWLHRTARNIAAQTIRTEVRRRNREKEAATMNEFPETDAPWEEIAPHLDTALAELSEPDRDAVLLRYFENKPAQEMAAILGINTEAAQKRVSRAVERLRKNFEKRGITAGAAGLTGLISANALQAAPAGLAAVISSTALVGVVSSAAATTGILAMTALKKLLAAAVIATLAGTAIYQATRRSETGAARQEPGGTPLSSTREPKEEKSVVEQLAKVRDERPRIDRKAELERLKVKWMETEVDNGIVTKEHEKLADETAAALLCGEEALELVSFLNANRRVIAASLVKDGISKYLASKNDPEARKLLVEACEKNGAEIRAQQRKYDPLAWKSAASGRHELLGEWSKAAGRSCSPETLEELRGELTDRDFANQALIGYNTQLMRTDPEAAVRDLVKALESQNQSLSSFESIKLLFWEPLPSDIDFAKLESLIPTQTAAGDWHPGDDPYRTGRQELFRTWAKTDPAAAANYVIAHPDRVAPTFVQEIIGSQYYKDPDGLIGWVSQFPEGPYFDHAAASAAIYARGQPGIDELIAKIQDPKLRTEAEKSARVPLTNPDTR